MSRRRIGGGGLSGETQPSVILKGDEVFAADFTKGITPLIDQGDGYSFDADSDGAQHTHTDFEGIVSKLNAEESRHEGSRRIFNMIPSFAVMNNSFTPVPASRDRWELYGYDSDGNPIFEVSHISAGGSQFEVSLFRLDTALFPVTTYDTVVQGLEVMLSPSTVDNDVPEGANFVLVLSNFGSTFIPFQISRSWQRVAGTSGIVANGLVKVGVRSQAAYSYGKILVKCFFAEKVSGATNQNPSIFVPRWGGEWVTSDRLRTLDASSNGSINPDVGWTGAGWSISAPGYLDNGVIFQSAFVKHQTKPFALYRISYQISVVTLSVVVGPDGATIVGGNTIGSHTWIIRAGATPINTLVFVGGATPGARISNLSVVEVDESEDGANVSGVRYSDLSNGNTVASNNVVTEAQGKRIQPSIRKGLLIEEQRTNLALRSEDISNAAWVAANITKGSVTVATPAGTSSITVRLTATAANGTLKQTITSASATRQYSVWMKRVTGTGNIQLTIDNGATWTTVTLTSKWQRFTISQAAVTNPVIGVRIVTSGDAIDFWGSQLENGNFPTSYIPTEGSTVTRDADILEYGTENYADKITAVAEFEVDYVGATTNNRDIVAFSVGGAEIAMGLDTTGKPFMVSSSGGGILYLETGASTVTPGRHKIACRMSGTVNDGSCIAYFDGVRIDATPLVFGTTFAFTPTEFRVGNGSSALYPLNGKIVSVRIYPPGLSDAEVQELSA